MKQGYDREQLNHWRIARFVAFKSLEPHLEKNSGYTMFDMLPLEGDPTKEDRQRAQMEEKRKNDEFAKALVEKYKQMGIIKENK